MLADLSAAELEEWFAFYALEEVRDDLGSALVAATLHNQNRRKGARAIRPLELAGYLEQERARWRDRLAASWAPATDAAQSAEETIAFARALVAAYGGEDRTAVSKPH